MSLISSILEQLPNLLVKIIFNKKLFFFILFFCQIGALYFWHKTIKSKLLKRICLSFYVIINILWFFTFFYYLAHKNHQANPLTLAWIYRPMISWQVIHVLWALAYFSLKTFNLFLKILKKIIFRKKNKQIEINFYPTDKKRRKFLTLSAKTLAAASLIAPLSAGSYALYRQGAKVRIRKQVLEYKNCPQELDNFKIAHITDLHLGLWTSQKEIYTTFKLAADSKADLVMITGDWVDRTAEFSKLYEEPLKLFKDVPYGVFGVLGNHDHYVGAEQVRTTLRSFGVHLLSDQSYNLADFGVPIFIVGLEDPGWGNWYMEELAQKTAFFKKISADLKNDKLFKLLMNHRPENFKQIVAAGFDLYLAGHTHGGQYGFRGEKNLAGLFYEYSRGSYQEKNSFLNISCGLSAVGVPFRFGPWPEIDILTIKKIN